ncbi:MAG: alpha/beta hydrolase [Verrucomicrobiales bacterium]
MSLKSWPRRYWTSFSYVGLILAALFFAASLSPSLLPRLFLVQGILSGIALAIGYGIGGLLVWLWQYLELPQPRGQFQRIGKWAISLIAVAIAGYFLWRATDWQNSIRGLMDMEQVPSVYSGRVALIAALIGALLIALARVFEKCCRFVNRRFSKIIPLRVSKILSLVLVSTLLITVVKGVFARRALMAADAMYLKMDGLIDDGIEQPVDPMVSGSGESLIPWKTIGRRGKNFAVGGPTENDISGLLGKPALKPLRVYVGLGSAESPEERAGLALRELERVGGFDRSVLVVATPTGTGWLDPGAVDTLEYLHAGDTAIVSMQYSYLASFLTIIVDPERSREAAVTLFDEIYEHWKTLPEDRRPKLYLHGLSLGSLGSEACLDLFTLFDDPIQGAVWSGPPFPSEAWSEITRDRNPGSPAWLPEFRDGSMVRFTARENALDQVGDRWGPMRFVYLQHASDPISFFSPDLLYRRPVWLEGERGPDISPDLEWYPIVTFLQVACDMPMGGTVPHGYGHLFTPASYIDAWIAVTSPPDWSPADTDRLKQHFAKPVP